MNFPYVLFLETGGQPMQKLIAGIAPGRSWQALVVRDSEAALEVLNQRQVAMVVVGWRSDLPACKNFLEQVKARQPAVMRLALLAQADQVDDALPYVHQVLASACQAPEWAAAIDRGVEVWQRLQGNAKLASVLSQLHHLPSPPALYFALRDELDSPTGSLRSIAELLARDAALVARILRIANSGFYARPRQITDLHEAVGLLGMDLVLGIVMSAYLFDRLPLPGFNLDELWKHNFAVAKLAQHIAKQEGCPGEWINAAGLAGLLHDVGELVFLANLPGRYQGLMHAALGDERRLLALEHEALGVGHPEIGAMILSLWNLADPVVEAVACHHSLNDTSFPQAKPVTKAVFLAEQLVVEFALQSQETHDNQESPSTFAIDPKWREMCKPLLTASLTD